MNLMQNESVLLETEGKSLVLTTHRIRYHVEALGYAEIKSIMLDELASCAMVRSSNVILLVLAGASFVLGLLVAVAGRGNEAALVVGIVMAVVLLIAYFGSRRQILAFASAGTTISVNTQGMKLETARHFIEQTEWAKNARYLHGRS